MAKQADLGSLKPKQFTKRFPVSGEPDVKPKTTKMVQHGYGAVAAGRKKESAIVKQSRRALIARLGIK